MRPLAPDLTQRMSNQGPKNRDWVDVEGSLWHPFFSEALSERPSSAA